MRFGSSRRPCAGGGLRSVEIDKNQPTVRAGCAREEGRETHRYDQSWIILEVIVELPDELLLVLLWGCTKGRLAKVGRWRILECRLRARKGRARSAERRRESSRTDVSTSESARDGCRAGSLELSEGPARRWYESKGGMDLVSVCATRDPGRQRAMGRSTHLESSCDPIWPRTQGH